MWKYQVTFTNMSLKNERKKVFYEKTPSSLAQHRERVSLRFIVTQREIPYSEGGGCVVSLTRLQG